MRVDSIADYNLLRASVQEVVVAWPFAVDYSQFEQDKEVEGLDLRTCCTWQEFERVATVAGIDPFAWLPGRKRSELAVVQLAVAEHAVCLKPPLAAVAGYQEQEIL